MKTLYAVFVISLIAFYLLDDNGRSNRAPTAVTPAIDSVIAPAPDISQPLRREVPSANTAIPNEFGKSDAGTQVRGSGSVTRILSDDNSGSKHQRFIIKLASGQTLLVAHNIDLAPRVAGIAVNDRVQFHGEYEWNSQGGVVHWTHSDPNGRHINGSLRSKGRTYQ